MTCAGVRVGQVLEKGAPFVQQPILNVLHCLLHYMELGQAASHPINADLLRAVARYAQVRAPLCSLLRTYTAAGTQRQMVT